MALYTVLYHDPLRLTADDTGLTAAAHAVWVCKDDRYAFEVHALGVLMCARRVLSVESYGETRYRRALATLGALHAERVARVNPLQSDIVRSRFTPDDLEPCILETPDDVAIDGGEVIHTFVVA